MSNLKYAFNRGEGWNVVGLRGKVLVAGGHRGGFCEKDLEAAPYLGRAPLFSRAEPISDVVLRLCESIFKTGKKCCATQQPGSEKQPCRCQGQCRRRGRGAPGAGAEVPCGLW